MKKILLIFACFFQFANAQTKPSTGEYLSQDRNNYGINLFLNEDKTFQMFVLSGTYEIKNDSIIFENNTANSSLNTFDVQFTKGKTDTKKVTIFVEPTYIYGGQYLFLGIQNKADGEIIYKSINEYFDDAEIEEYFEKNHSEKEEEIKVPFTIDKPYAFYIVQNRDNKAKIEKYIIPSDVSEVKIDTNFSLFDEFEMTGKIEDTNTLKVYANKSTPLKFVNKNVKTIKTTETPASKTIEKNWTYPGKKDYNEFFADSAAVAVDTAAAYYTDYENESRFEFKAKIEKNLKEALLNIKKDTITKYLFVYYNLKDKKAEKNFKDLIDEYNVDISNIMYSEYDALYDSFNFYLATKNDEAFFKKNKIKDKSVIILNKDGKVIATSEKKLNDISYGFSHDTPYIKNKLKQSENTIQLSDALLNKKTSIPDLKHIINANYEDFFTKNYYRSNVTKSIHFKTETNNSNDEDEIPYTELAIVDSAAVAYENNDFTFKKYEVSEKVLAEKLNLIFDYYNSKNIVDNELVNILLGEISGNHKNYDLFKNEDTSNNKQEIKYINYILKYNGDKTSKLKIADILNNFIEENYLNDPDSETYQKIRYSLISYSDNNFGIIQSVIENLNSKELCSDEANNLVDLLYHTIVNDKPIFENLDTHFNNLNANEFYDVEWNGFKNKVNTLFNAQAWDVFELSKTKDFERAIKWSELSNIVDKNNPYSLDTLGQLYFAVGRKQEAITTQTKAVKLAKEMKINHEEFEQALNNMKK